MSVLDSVQIFLTSVQASASILAPLANADLNVMVYNDGMIVAQIILKRAIVSQAIAKFSAEIRVELPNRSIYDFEAVKGGVVQALGRGISSDSIDIKREAIVASHNTLTDLLAKGGMLVIKKKIKNKKKKI